MNERCPACGLAFSRDAGYFLGAMYFSYGMGIAIITAFSVLAYLVFPDWRLYQLVLLAWAAFLPFTAIVFRYSRVFWIHLDRYFDPDSTEGE